MGLFPRSLYKIYTKAKIMAYKNIKDALGATSWDESYGYYFTIDYDGEELQGSLDYTKGVLDNPDLVQIKKIITKLKAQDEKAHKLIQKAYPDEDATELFLSDLILYGDGSFSLGYGAGESPAGQLYLYVRFNSDFTMDEELIHEIY